MPTARFLLAFAALWLAARPAPAEAADALAMETGVRVEAGIDAEGALAVAVVPDGGVLLNGVLGIAFEPGEGPAVWPDAASLLLTFDGDYFPGAARRRIAFDRTGLTAPARLGVVYGACLPESGVCVLEKAEIVLTPLADGATGLALAARGP